MTQHGVRDVNELSFDDEVLRSDVPVLVEFTGQWCPPCRHIAPFVAQLATEYAGRAKVAVVDADVCAALASRYGVRGLPTLLVFRHGEVVSRQLGAAPKQRIARMIDEAL